MVYFTFKLIDSKTIRTSDFTKIKFSTGTLQTEGFVQDSTYYFDVIVENISKEDIDYQVQATCGCTVVGDINRVISSNLKDTLNISVSTYNRSHSFNTELLLYNNNVLVDSLKIFMINKFEN